MEDKRLLFEYRKRLGSISWLMRCINEPIAKRSNKEDLVKGHFWESRFYSQALLDEAAALTCMAYVDLNPIRAGITNKIEESHYTSILQRTKSMRKEQLNEALTAISGSIRKSILNVTLKDYIELVEWTGKNIIHSNKSRIPSHLSSIFERQNLNQDNWLRQIKTYNKNYSRAVGTVKSLNHFASRLKLRWIKGINQVKDLYFSPI